MLFKPELAEKIIAGEKTQTRRVVKFWKRNGVDMTEFAGCAENHIIVEVIQSPDSDHTGIPDRIKWRIGYDYAVVPKRGAKGIAKITLMAIRQEPLQNITEEDAIAEGCVAIPERDLTARDSFIALWQSINKQPGVRWSDNPTVWVLQFKLKEQ